MEDGSGDNTVSLNRTLLFLGFSSGSVYERFDLLDGPFEDSPHFAALFGTDFEELKKRF